MQDSEGRAGLSGTARLMVLMVVVFILQQIDEVFVRSGVQRYLALDPSLVLKGCVWQFFTYQLLHAGPIHILFNMLALWCFGRPLEMRFGARYMTLFFFLSGVAGGLMHLATGFLMQNAAGPVVGASAGTSGLLAAFCLMEPDGMIILYFVPVRARYVLVLSIGLSLFFILRPDGSNVAHGAHLGGLLAGILFLRKGLPGIDWISSLRWPATGRRGGRQAGGTGAPGWSAEPVASAKPVPRGDFISREIDPILDKISTHGIHSLTPEERKILESARSRMNQR